MLGVEYQQPALIDDPSIAAVETTPIRSMPTLPLLGDWCERAGENGGDRLRVTGEIAGAYVNAQQSACATLTQGMDTDHLLAWQNYLVLYTQVMAGCEELTVPPPQGIRAFGLANTPAVGIERPSLSEADARLLTGLYVPLFADRLALDGTETVLLEDQLWRSAAPEIAAEPSGDLKVCAPLGAPGAPGG
jgi:hypothetical protein